MLILWDDKDENVDVDDNGCLLTIFCHSSILKSLLRENDLQLKQFLQHPSPLVNHDLKSIKRIRLYFLNKASLQFSQNSFILLMSSFPCPAVLSFSLSLFLSEWLPLLGYQQDVASKVREEICCISTRKASSMPVTGLPPSLETVLNTFLQEMSLTSFKIDGRENQTVIVLRLSPAHQLPATHSQCDSVVYGRKGAAQIARDKRRVETHKVSLMKKHRMNPVSPSELFLPTPPSLFYNTENETAMDTFKDGTPTDTLPRAVEFARATRPAVSSLSNLCDVDPVSVIVQQHQLTMGDWSNDDDTDRNIDTEDAMTVCSDTSTIPPVTLTDYSSTEDVTGNSKRLKPIKTNIESPTAINEARNSTTVSPEDCKMLMEHIQQLADTMDRGFASLKKPAEDGNPPDTPSEQPAVHPHR